MPQINLTIAIKVKNYQDIVRDEKGDFLAFIAGLPVISWPITSHVDSLIVDGVKAELTRQIGPKIEKALLARGIRARVNVTLDSDL